MRVYLAIFLGIFLSTTVCGMPKLHPDMEKAIKANEESIRKTGKPASPDYVVIDGVKRFTGFHPTYEFYAQVKELRVKADPKLIAEWKARGGLDYRKVSYSPVHGQIWGSCWAEGAGSTHDFNVNRQRLAAGLPPIVTSVQDYIDCSGFGTARNGGQIALPYGERGIALDSDYPYNGKDNRCKTDVKRDFPLLNVAVIRGENGDFPNEAEALTAFFTYGAMEVCGSASAMKGGGRQDNPGTGSTNHCYSWASAVPGAALGWLDAWYHGMKNSWGDGSNSIWNLVRGNWGDKGWGDYRLSRDGVTWNRQSVVTEMMIAWPGEYAPPKPVEFTMKGTNATKFKVTVSPGKLSSEKVKKALQAVGYEVVE